MFVPFFLVSLSLILFRLHISGAYTYFGNPDRLNNNLKVLKGHVDSLSQGQISLWNKYELLGFDTLSLPYTFPSPITLITSFFGSENIYITSGFISVCLLSFSGIAAYAFCRSLVSFKPAAFVAAVLYQFSAISILKVSQNDLSFAVFILIPIMMLVVKHVKRNTSSLCLVLLSTLLFLLLQFTFLQKAAYAVILLSSYAMYLSFSNKNWWPTIIFFSALFIAIIGVLPRLYWLGIAMKEYTRLGTRHVEGAINDAMMEGTGALQLLRWLDGTIYGSNFASSTSGINGINLSEGFLLYTCAMLPFLLILMAFRHLREPLVISIKNNSDASFFLLFLLFTCSVVVVRPINELVHLLFLKISFIHARILIVGLLPMVALVAIALDSICSKIQYTSKSNCLWKNALLGLLALVVLFCIEVLATQLNGDLIILGRALSLEALARIALSALLTLILFLFIFLKNYHLQKSAFVLLLICLPLQSFIAADKRLNSDWVVNSATPFYKGNFYYAHRDEFYSPSDSAIQKLHQKVKSDNYRSVILCNPEIAGGFCAAHLGTTWQIRLVDGYYGMGLPTRLAMLPWPSGAGLRHLSFTDIKQLPWDILGFLNVNQAMIPTDTLYYSKADVSNEIDSIQIIKNPALVAPRWFFASEAVPASTPKVAMDQIFSDGRPKDVTLSSVVEGIAETTTFEGSGSIALEEDGDRISLTFEPSLRDRFIVLNELYYPGWVAKVDDMPARIFATNVVMRGVIIPAGTKRLVMQFKPLPTSGYALIFILMSIILTIIGAISLRHSLHSNRSST